MRSFILALCLLSLAPFSRADVMPTPMHQLFYGSSIIAEVKITSNTQSDYRMKIVDIHHDRQIGLKAGDYVKIEKNMNVVLSSESVDASTILSRASGIAFLLKTEKGWYVRRFCIQNEESKKVQMYIKGCAFTGKPSELKQQIKAYFKEFDYSKEQGITGKLTAKQLKKADLPPLVLYQYTRIYLGQTDSSVYERCGCKSDIITIEED